MQFPGQHEYNSVVMEYAIACSSGLQFGGQMKLHFAADGTGECGSPNRRPSGAGRDRNGGCRRHRHRAPERRSSCFRIALSAVSHLSTRADRAVGVHRPFIPRRCPGNRSKPGPTATLLAHLSRPYRGSSQTVYSKALKCRPPNWAGTPSVHLSQSRPEIISAVRKRSSNDHSYARLKRLFGEQSNQPSTRPPLQTS